MNAEAQIIKRNGKPEYAVLPIAAYNRLLTLAEDMEDLVAADQAVNELRNGRDEWVPADMADALLNEADKHG